jgi:polyphosphate kinase
VRKDGTVPHHHYFVWIEEVVAANLESLFPGMKVVEAHPFRVTRNADMIIQELEASDLLETMEESVRKRRFGDVVRLSVNENMPNRILEILINNLEVDYRDVYALKGSLGLSNLMQLYRIERYDLKYKPFLPATPPPLRFTAGPEDGTIFSAIRREDILLHHPYDSFVPVIDFLKHAARDPNVLAIKQTLYRVGSNSPVVKTLLEARRDYGKQVAALVELKARFDEESNIGWAKMLEREGVHVTYGLLGLKTHSKIILVVRKEGEHIRRYVHLGTGNYNHITAQLYEDIGMFTCDEEIGADATDLFNYLTGYSAKNEYRKLMVAPINLRERFEELIHQEIELHKAGGNGHLIFKMNALVDKRMIKLLYEASQTGVQVDLLVRGYCCLRPGIEGLSENIRVISIVGRFLEHSRIYYFKHGGAETVYMGSADLMPRNLNQRVEVLFPVNDPRLIRHIRDTILETYLTDNVKARIMQPDGSYKRVQPEDGEQELLAQFDLMKKYQLASEV